MLTSVQSARLRIKLTCKENTAAGKKHSELGNMDWSPSPPLGPDRAAPGRLKKGAAA